MSNDVTCSIRTQADRETQNRESLFLDLPPSAYDQGAVQKNVAIQMTKTEFELNQKITANILRK